MLAKRIDDYTIRSHDNPLKTNAQRQSHSRNPFDAVLYSHREQVPSTLGRLALRTTARRFIEHQNSLPQMIALPPSVFEFCSPGLPSAARTSRHRPCPAATGLI